MVSLKIPDDIFWTVSSGFEERERLPNLHPCWIQNWKVPSDGMEYSCREFGKYNHSLCKCNFKFKHFNFAKLILPAQQIQVVMICASSSSSNALCSYPHVNVEIRDLSQTFTTAPICPWYHYFRENIWVNIWVQFHFHSIFLHVINWNNTRHLLRGACTWY